MLSQRDGYSVIKLSLNNATSEQSYSPMRFHILHAQMYVSSIHLFIYHPFINLHP